MDSTYLPSWNNLGRIYRETNRYDESEKMYRKALALNPDFMVTYVHYAILKIKTGDLQTAFSYLEQAIQKGLTDYQGIQTDPQIAPLREQKEQWDALMKKFFADKMYYNLACEQSLKGELEQAFESLELSLTNGWKNYDWMQQDSDLAPLREQKDRWEALMQNAIVPDRTDAKAWNSLGQVYIQTGNYTPAEMAMSKAVALDATSAPYRSHLGYIYLNLKRYPEAEAAFTKAIVLDPAFANARKHLGMVCFKTDRPDEATRHFLKALELNPDYAGAMLGMAYLLHSEGKTTEAIGYVEQAIGKGSTLEQLEKDEDLAPLRTLPEWKVLMKKHFPDQSKE